MMAKLPSYFVAVLCSLGLHGLLLAVVIIGWTPETKHVQIRPSYIKATLLQVKPAKAPVAKKPVVKKPVDNKRQKLVAKKRAAAKKAAEAKRLVRLREDKKRQQEQEKKRARDKARDKEAQEQKAADQLRRQQELAFAEALNDEEEYITAEQDQQLVGSYSAYIRDHIANNWSRPPSARRGMKVVLSIQLVPTGRVIAVTVEKSSGNKAFDRSAEQAVYKVERFERLQELSRANPLVFENTFRHFRLVFTPDDLRL